MKLRERIGLAIAGKSFFGIPEQGSSAFVDSLGIPATPVSRELYGNYKGITYAAISRIATSISTIENYVTDRVDKTKRIKHAFLRVLENPNSDMTKSEFFEAHQSFMSMSGESFWYFALGEKTKLPKEVYLLRPDRVKVILDKGIVSAYKLSKNNSGDYILLSPHEVYHHKYFNPNNAFRGLGPLQAGLEYVQTESFATKFTRNYLYNNATPAGVISLQAPEGKGEVSKEAYDKFKRQWRENMSSAENAGKVAVVRGMEVSFEKIGMSLGDIDLKELRKLSDEQILKMFGVPKGLLGESDQQGLGRANIEALEYIYSKYTIEPNMVKIDDAVQKLIKRFYKDDVVVKHENIIPEDKEYNLKYLEAGIDKWITRDEQRIEEGRDVMGADQLYTLANQFPIESTKKMVKFVKSVSKEETNLDWDVTDKSDTAKHEIFRKNTIERLANPYYKKFKKEVVAFVNKQEEKVLSKFGKSVTAKEFEEVVLNIGEETVQLTSDVYPVLISLAQETGNETLQFIGMDRDFLLGIDAEKMIREHATKMAYSFNVDTVKQLSETLAQGFSAGESKKELTARVKTVFGGAKTWRNDRIARNETHWTSVNSTEMAYQQSDYVKYKKWYANPGACQFCLSFDGKVEAIGQPFAVKGTTIEGKDGGKYMADYEDIQNTHIHPNCKCTLLPMAERKSYKGIDINARELPEVEVDSIEKMIEEKFSAGLENIKAELTNDVNAKVAEFEEATDRLKEVLDGEQ